MKKNQIIMDGSGSMARQEGKHQGFQQHNLPEGSKLRNNFLHEIGLCSRKGKTGEASGPERPNDINHFYEQMELERIGNKNVQIFYNQ